MEINVDPTQVERAVAEAIINSAIGAKIKVAVAGLIGKEYNNPIEKAVEGVISEVALKMIRDEYTDQIRAAVKAKMEEDTVEAFVQRFWDQLLESKHR